MPCPEIAKDYNSAMGVVDLTDMLIALYSTKKTHRWYLKSITSLCRYMQSKFMAVISSICKSAFHSQEKSKGSIKFSSKIADALLYELSLLIDLEDVTERNGRSVVTPSSSNCSRTDETGHWPAFRNKKVNADFAKRALFAPLV